VKTLALGFLALALAIPAAATPITGDLVISGLDTYGTTSITFHNPGFVVAASGSLSAMLAAPMVNLSPTTFATAPGTTLFDFFNGGTEIKVVLLSLNVLSNSSALLHLSGTDQISQTGFDTTRYTFSLSSIRFDDGDAYVLALAPVPEPAPLILLGSVLLGLAIYGLRRIRRSERHVTMG
jgi:hypothetical protein